MAMGDQLAERTGQGKGVNAPMAFEALVLIGQQHAPEARIDVLGFHRQAPASICGDEGAQHRAVPVLHQLGKIVEVREIRREQPVERYQSGRCEDDKAEYSARENPPAGTPRFNPLSALPLASLSAPGGGEDKGEVGESRRSGTTHLTPTLSALKGGEGV